MVYLVNLNLPDLRANRGFDWNERLEDGAEQYHPDEIKDRLRKGRQWTKGSGAAGRCLEFWQAVYKGDLSFNFASATGLVNNNS